MPKIKPIKTPKIYNYKIQQIDPVKIRKVHPELFKILDKLSSIESKCLRME